MIWLILWDDYHRRFTEQPLFHINTKRKKKNKYFFLWWELRVYSLNFLITYSRKNYINHIDVKYVDYNDKEIKTMSFNILDNDALIEIVKFIAEKQ